MSDYRLRGAAANTSFMTQPPTVPEQTPLLDLERFIPFQIYRLMAKAASAAAADYARWGISIQEARLLILVLARPGLRAGNLSEAACLDASALSHMMRHLAGKGLIRRERHAEERRSVQVFLTEAGLDVAQRCAALGASHQRLLLAGLSEAEIDMLRAAVARMLKNVDLLPVAPSPWKDIEHLSVSGVSAGREAGSGKNIDAFQ